MADTAELPVSACCVDLDSLFDTRLGTIAIYGKEAVQKTFGTDGIKYLMRNIDEFDGIDKETYKTAYANRDKRSLVNAVRTEILDVVLDYMFDVEIESYNTPYQAVPCITINTWPYVLDDDEASLLISMFVKLTMERSDIRLIHKSPAELTPEFIRNEFSLVIMYDYENWISTQSELGNFNQKCCPKVSLFVPDIYGKRLPTKAEVQEAKEYNMSFHEMLEEFVKPFIGLKFIPVKLFCISCTINNPTPPEQSA